MFSVQPVGDCGYLTDSCRAARAHHFGRRQIRRRRRKRPREVDLKSPLLYRPCRLRPRGRADRLRFSPIASLSDLKRSPVIVFKPAIFKNTPSGHGHLDIRRRRRIQQYHGCYRREAQGQAIWKRLSGLSSELFECFSSRLIADVAPEPDRTRTRTGLGLLGHGPWTRPIGQRFEFEFEYCESLAKYARARAGPRPTAREAPRPPPAGRLARPPRLARIFPSTRELPNLPKPNTRID